MSDRVFFGTIFAVVGLLMFADCYRSHVHMAELQQRLQKAYEHCDSLGIPRVRCPI